MTFFERYEAVCKKRNIQPVSQLAAENLGCSKSNISAFAKNGTTPKGEVVAGAAKMLDVSADYLLGLTEKEHPIEVSEEYSENEKHIISFFRELNEEGQRAVLAVVSGLAGQDIYKNANQDGDISERIC